MPPRVLNGEFSRNNETCDGSVEHRAEMVVFPNEKQHYSAAVMLCICLAKYVFCPINHFKTVSKKCVCQAGHGGVSFPSAQEAARPL